MVENPTYEELLSRVAELEKAQSVQQQKENGQKEALDRYQTLLGLNDRIVYKINLSAREIEWSERYYPFFGLAQGDAFTAEEFLYGQIHPDDLTTYKLERARAQQEDGVIDLEYRMRHQNGEYLWVHDRGIIELDGNGAPLSITGVIWDVSTLRLTEQKQRETEQAFNASSDLIAIVDTDFRTLRINRAMADRLEIEADDAIGTLCYGLMGEADVCPGCPHVTMLETRSDASEKIKWQALDAEYLLTCSPYIDRRNVVVGSVHVAHDLSDLQKIEEMQRRLEQKMQQAQRLESLGMLAGGIAHDFNNLLQIILGSATFMQEMLTKNPDLVDADLMEALNDIITSGRSGAELSNLMLAYSGKESIRALALDINETIRDLVHLARSRISEHAEVALNLASEKMMVLGEKGQVQQILMNPIINAAEAIEGQGTITISTQKRRYSNRELDAIAPDMALQTGDYVQIKITDTGSGMTKAALDQIFDPFFSTKFTGRGMGLSAVHGIVKASKGTVTVKSKLGKGTEFTILLPFFEEDPS